MSAADQVVPGRLLAGGAVVIESLLGAGSIGAVFRAQHTRLRRPVAVKVLHRAFQSDVEFCRRFYAEALAMSRLDHANLVRVHDFGQEPDGLLYLSMEYLEGKTLRDLLPESGLDLERIVARMSQVCAGLQHAHTRGLIHRDMKLDNVMIVQGEDDDSRPVEVAKVCDFGFAVPPSVSGEVAQRLAGTPVYMSPEQCRGEELDVRSDVYACGVMLYELATGTVPFLSDDVRTVMSQHVNARPPRVLARRPDLDPRFEDIVQKALAKSRADRFATVTELRTELRMLLRESIRLSIAPPSSARSSLPDWLEVNSPTSYMPPSSRDPGEILASDPKGWMKKLIEEQDPNAFMKRIGELDRAVRQLAARGEAKTLSTISSALYGIASEGTHARGSRANLATGVLKLFSSPEILAPIAERMLQHEEERDTAIELLTRSGVAGVHAIYAARVKLATEQAVRVPFVQAMKKLEAACWPIVKAALERMPPGAMSGSHPAAAELAEDLLLAVPAVHEDDARRIVTAYAASPVGGVSRAAARAVTRVLREDARPLLLELLGRLDDGVRLAAIAGLLEIGAVDIHAVQRIAAFLASESAAHPRVQAAGITALANARPEAMAAAADVLARVVAASGHHDANVLAAAKSLVVIDRERGLRAVLERASRSVEPLRSHLSALASA